MYAMSHKILLVDDDAHIRQLLAFALGKAGMKTSEAGDGEAALKEVERDRPDLVVLDINMPRMDGLEVCRRLRAAGDLPILFLSSRDDEIDRVLGLELGGDDYVVKPFSPREVVARVTAILKRGPGARVGGAEFGLVPTASASSEALEAHGTGTGAGPGPRVPAASAVAILPSKVFSLDSIIDRPRPGFESPTVRSTSHSRTPSQVAALCGADHRDPAGSATGSPLPRRGLRLIEPED